MSKNNPVGNIPTKRPILNRMKNAVIDIYMGLSEDEMKALQSEINSVTETNCDYKIYDIAQMLKNCVDTVVNGMEIANFSGGRKVKYKCIKEMCLPKCDGDGFEIPNEYGFVIVGSIWERDDRVSYIGGEVHLDSLNDDSYFGWIEMSFEELKENFVQIEA